MQARTKRVALYCRMSQDRTGAGLGVERQERECRELVAKMSGHAVAAVFTDNDVSATNGKPRPEYLRLLDAIRAGQVDAVAAWHTDRLHRSPLELETYIDLNVPTYTVRAGALDLETPTGRMTARLLGAVARQEVEVKSDRQRSKNLQTALAGLPPAGGPVPWGYLPDRLTLHPEHSETFRAIYRRILGGEALGSVIRWLNARGVATPRGRATWTYSTLRGVLTRPLNAGLQLYDGTILTEVETQWAPLVTVDEHYAMTTLLNDPTRRTTTGNGRRHLLAGIATCRNCRKPLKSGAVGSRSGKVSNLYRCGNPDCVARVHVSREQLDAYVIGRLLDERGEAWVARRKSVENVGALLAAKNAEIGGITARLGEDGADELGLMAKLSTAKAERAELQKPRSVGWKLTDVYGDWHRADDNLDERRAILLNHLDELSIASRGKTSHRFDSERVTLTWQPDRYDEQSDLADRQGRWG